MEQETYTLVKSTVKKMLDISLDHYKDEQMRRRLDSWLVRSGNPTWSDYFKRLHGDAKELERFRNYLTINVSAFFRDIDRWHSLRENVLKNLLADLHRLQLGRSNLRVWSAGCSIGPEPYTLAMILDEMSPGSETSPLGRRGHTILATDIDRGALAKAKARGPFNADEIQNMTAAQRSAYLDPGGPPYYVRESLMRKVDFQEHNLLSDPPPPDIDLVVCRNVVIYFTTEAKDMLYRKFYQALRPGGVLFVGATEILPRPQDIGFRPNGISFYLKG